MHRKLVLKLALAAALAASIPAAVAQSEVEAGCPGGFSCPDVWMPVTCSNGVTYSNACYAALACATGCVGGGAASS